MGTFYQQWQKVILIVVTNPPTTSGYQARVVIPWQPGMNDDFSDLRFSDYSRTLPYWIEHTATTSRTSAVVWVKLTETGESCREFFCYYGNGAAVSESNGETTFDFFDDFDGSSSSKPDSNKWDLSGDGVNGTVIDLDGNGRLRIKLAHVDWSGGAILAKTANFSTSTSRTIEARATVSSYMYNTAYGVHVGFTDKYAQDTNYYEWGRYTCSKLWDGGSSNGRMATSVSTETHGSYSLEDPRGKTGIITHRLDIPNTTSRARFVYGSTDTTLENTSSFQNTALYPQLGWGDYATGSGYYSYFDWVRVRTYAATEATCTPTIYGLNRQFYGGAVSEIGNVLTVTFHTDHMDLVWTG